MKAMVLGILSSFFFASTFVLNRAMNLSGGSWIWSAVLRYIFMVPPLLVIVYFRGNLKQLCLEMWSKPWSWLGWSTIGFGLFYAPLCFAADYGPAWLVASTWQTTIIAGSLLAPFFWHITVGDNGPIRVRGKIPIKGLYISLLILIGVVLIQQQRARVLELKEILLGILPVLAAAFAYPLGNRKMMAVCANRLDTFQRVLGMTLASMPFWILLSIFGLLNVGVPKSAQVAQALLVAICSGVIATILFFRATDMTKGDQHKLAAVEATQSGEVVFSLLGEILILHGSYPTYTALAGIALVILGMILHSFIPQK